MPTRKRASIEGPSRAAFNLYRLRRITLRLESGDPLLDEDRDFLVSAFGQINDGADPSIALGIKVKRGERKHEDPRARLAMSFIATAIAPLETGGLGMSLDDAIACTAEEREGEASFGLSEETLRYYWSHGTYGKDRDISRPIETLPHRPDRK